MISFNSMKRIFISYLRKILNLLIEFPSDIYKNICRSTFLPLCKYKIAQQQRNNCVIKVGFFVISNATENFWEPLYDLFSKDDRFDPYMVIVPYTYASEEYKISTVSNLKELIVKSGRKVVVADEPNIRESVCCRHFFAYGLVFHMDPYTWLCNPETQMRNLTRSLIFYTPYSYCIVNKDNAFELKSLKHPYKILPETRLHINCHQKYGITKGKNVSPFLGYMGVHKLLNTTKCQYNWRLKKSNVKKVIIAPHHVLGLGNILRLSQFYLLLARHYENQISFVFKPHPYLKEDLKKYWSETDIKNYYSQWDKMPNTQLEEGEYINLLKTSDAMILDSGAFNAEYSLLYKPLFFVEKKPRRKFNEVGEKIFNVQYHGHSENEIIDFIENVVLKENDILYSARKTFIDTYFWPPNLDIARNTYEYVLSTIKYSTKY